MQQEWIYGRHTVMAAIEAKVVQEICCTESVSSEVQALLVKANLSCELRVVDKTRLESLADSPQHQGVVARVPCMVPHSEQEFFFSFTPDEPAFILILDGVQDPHNLGAIIRSAAAFGVQWIVTPKDNAVGIKPSVRKIACGLEHQVPWAQVTNLARFVEKLQQQNVWVYAADMQGAQPLSQLDWRGHVAMIFGAEGKGVRPLVRKKCDGCFHIPMAPAVESLNVSVATAISLYTVQTQRTDG